MANTLALTFKAQNNHPASSVIAAVTQQIPDLVIREQSLQSAVFEITGTSASNTLAVGAAGIIQSNLAGGGAVTLKDPITGSNLNVVSHRGLFLVCKRAAEDTAPTTTPAAGNYPTGIASTTSLAIGTGSKAFTVAGSLGITNGSRFRAVSATGGGANYMEGTATYSGTTLTMTSDAVGGSGTLADWTIYGLPVAQVTSTGFGATVATAINMYENSAIALFYGGTSELAKVAATSGQTLTVSLVGTSGLKVSVFAIGE